jgi:hypothetical protein
VDEVVTDNVDEPDPETLDGLSWADPAPAGRPVTFRATSALNPYSEPTLSAYDVLDPRRTVRLVGVAAMVKSGDGETTSVASTVCEIDPETATTENG